MESEPWGYESTHRFLNIGLELTVSCGAKELFGDLMEIQGNICADSHRNATGGYADRMIDIDLIYYDDLVLDTASLTLPHPRMHLRDFVLQPVAKLAPAWRHPRLHLTAGEMLAALKDN